MDFVEYYQYAESDFSILAKNIKIWLKSTETDSSESKVP
jgi:hypothetical protein